MKLIKRMLQLFARLFNKSDKNLDEINEALKKAVIEQEFAKAKLKKKIYKHFKRQMLFGSKYIKVKGKSDHHVKMECYKVFGPEMKEVNLTLTAKMELV